ncbi:MAG TPA: response regulator [Nitrososphaera sp.]|jgi:CheY-like chemotaxis protein|nr:response regulator [Nitrososphaera sp.]
MQSQPNPPISPEQLKETNILIVDDEADILTVFKKTLETAGYSSYGFVNPSAALEHFRQNPKAYQVVVSDIRMPGMNGFQLSRQIRSINPDIKIILMTSFEVATDELQKVMPSLKIDGLIKKPLSIHKFRTIIEKTAK